MNTESVAGEGTIGLNEMARKMLEVAKKRDPSTSPIKLLKHCATEVVEATEVFIRTLYCSEDSLYRHREEFASELADVISCVLIISAHENLDINAALQKCYKKNLARAEGKGEKK